MRIHARPLLVSALIAAGFGAGWIVSRRTLPPDELSKIREAVRLIDQHHTTSVPREKLIDSALRGMAQELGRNNDYYTAAQGREMDERDILGRYGGVGIEISSDADSGAIRVAGLLEGGSAAAAGVRPGDILQAVDGWPVQGRSRDEIAGRIRGTAGTAVTLTLSREGQQPCERTLGRAEIRYRAVHAAMLPEGVGYLRIGEFTEMMQQFDAAVARLQAEGLKSLVIDLRFNRGGLLGECVALADRFLDKGTIVTTRGRDGEAQAYVSRKGDTLPAYPIVVLVNDGSASASEIFAAAIQENGRGAVVGMRTYGKGSVQTAFRLSDASRFKITTSLYFTPSGRNVDRAEGRDDHGVQPDYIVDLPPDEARRLGERWDRERIPRVGVSSQPPDPSDAQMTAALECLKAGFEGRAPRLQAGRPKKEKS